jgi:hypothetical protein
MQLNTTFSLLSINLGTTSAGCLDRYSATSSPQRTSWRPSSSGSTGYEMKLPRWLMLCSHDSLLHSIPPVSVHATVQLLFNLRLGGIVTLFTASVYWRRQDDEGLFGHMYKACFIIFEGSCGLASLIDGSLWLTALECLLRGGRMRPGCWYRAVMAGIKWEKEVLI